MLWLSCVWLGLMVVVVVVCVLIFDSPFDELPGALWPRKLSTRGEPGSVQHMSSFRRWWTASRGPVEITGAWCFFRT